MYVSIFKYVMLSVKGENERIYQYMTVLCF